MIANFKEHPPALWLALAEFDNIMRSPEGRRWLALHWTHPHVFHSIMMDLQQIFCLFASLPSCLEYRDEVRAGRPIAVLALEQLSEQARELCRKFQNIVPTMALGDYATIPTTLALFRPPGAPPASPRRPDTNNRPHHQRTPTPGAGKSHPQRQSADQHRTGMPPATPTAC
jgi:hypothetical protein